jgi:Domain of unknown function (DUF4270)
MTKTQLNRTTISIMNLWAKRIKLLSALAGVLFFFSCQEESSILGYKNPNSKFKVSYVEIPIESSVLLRDSLRTSNFNYSGEINRLLVGKYADEDFGEIAAAAFTQFFTTSQLKVGSTAVFDSVSMQLRFDLYNYGAQVMTPQMISVHELTQELKSDSLAYYFNKSNVAYSGLLGTKTFSINPVDFNKFAASSEDKDTVITIRLPLDFNFGQRLFNSALKYRDATTAADSTFVRFPDFVKEFKGIVIKPESADKILGFSPSATQAGITLHYHETDKDSLSIRLAFSPVIGFNQIKSDRSATELSALTQYYEESLNSSNNRYIQSGVGILTKLDFSKFYEFADTVPYVLINSAELAIESVEPSPHTPPSILSLRILEANNRMKKFSLTNPQDQKDLVAYNGFLRYDIPISNSAPVVENDSVFYASGDRSDLLTYSSTNSSYSGVMSLFFQQLTLDDESRTKFKYFVLYPGSQSTSTPAGQNGSKTVNRVVFPKDKIKLKVYYTKPTTQR